MKTAILCISDAYLVRGLQLRSVYEKSGDEVLILTPDFSHREKRRITKSIEGVRLVRHRPYTRNLSFDRLQGHREFAAACARELEEWKPERIHCLIPANSLARQMVLYKRRHPEVHLIFDVNDLWPESLPIPGFGLTPMAWYWKHLRSGYLKEADQVFAECGLFARAIEKEAHKPVQVLCWTLDQPLQPVHFVWQPAEIGICYLGSMNNILDIDWISRFLQALAALVPVRLHLIGAGENKTALLDACRSERIAIEDHGELYDPQKKQAVFDQCRFGLNVMKPGVQVGLSMKSLDYLAGGLPLINSLQGDTQSWIETEGIGIQTDRDDPAKTAGAIAGQKKEDHLAMRRKARAFYQAHLSMDAFEKTLRKALDG